MQKQTHRGEWWIPGYEDDPVAGEMTYKPQEGVELELFDSLDGSPDPLTPSNLDQIYGEVFEEGAVTLRNVHHVGGRLRGNSKVQQSVSASTAFLGEYVEDGRNFTEMEINFPDLNAFTSHNVIQNSPPSDFQ